MKVPFVDLYAQYLTLKPKIDEAIATVIQESAFIRGRFVAEFEKQYATKIFEMASSAYKVIEEVRKAA